MGDSDPDLPLRGAGPRPQRCPVGVVTAGRRCHGAGRSRSSGPTWSTSTAPVTSSPLRSSVRSRGDGSPTLVTAHEYKLMCANQAALRRAGGPVLHRLRRRIGYDQGPRAASPALPEGQPAGDPPRGGGGPGRRSALADADPLVLAPSGSCGAACWRTAGRAARVRHLDLPWGSGVRAGHRAPGTPGPVRDSVTSSGRLAPVKGADVLLRAWRGSPTSTRSVRLRVVGDGEDRPRLEDS